MNGDGSTREEPHGHSQELHDPRVFFAAARTLLAWDRTSLALMVF